MYKGQDLNALVLGAGVLGAFVLGVSLWDASFFGVLIVLAWLALQRKVRDDSERNS